MSDVTAAGPAPAAAPTGGFEFPSFAALGTMLKRGDIALAVGVLTILVVLILPLPRSCSTWRSRCRSSSPC
jgi:flagellar biosynthesis protein FlhA